MLMLCSACGHENIEGRLVCDSCGRLLIAAQTNTKKLVRPDDATPVPATVLRESLASDELILKIQATDQLERVKVPKAGIVIGRKDEAANITPDVDLTRFLAFAYGTSRRHCCITRRDNAFFVRDLNSVNGVRLNGHKIEPGVEIALHNRDVLHLGMLAIEVYFGGLSEGRS